MIYLAVATLSAAVLAYEILLMRLLAIVQWHHFAYMVISIALLAFAMSTHYWLSVLLLTFVGLGQAARMSLSNVLIQSYVDDEYRGRVMSIYMLEMSFLSIAIYPISLFADYFGPQ